MEETALDAIRTKNQFVEELRDYLTKKYYTEKVVTKKDEDVEPVFTGGCYCYKKSTKKIKEVHGFMFRKDFCVNPPEKSRDIAQQIHEFAAEKGLESKLQNNDKGNAYVTMKISYANYIVMPYIEGGHAGHISVSFNLLPF